MVFIEPIDCLATSRKKWLPNTSTSSSECIVVSLTDQIVSRSLVSSGWRRYLTTSLSSFPKPSGMGDVDELDAFQYLVHEEIHLAGRVSKRTRYWWQIAVLAFPKQ